MGLIKAALGSFGGVMADQWKEYFYCEAIPENVLAVKGQKKTSKRSSNTKGDENIITNGSVIAVADGQCMLIVDQGKIVDMCAASGEYTYGQVLGDLRRRRRAGDGHRRGDPDAVLRRAAEMKKRIFTYLLALLAALTLVVPAWAEQTEDDLFVYDTENLLTEDEWLELELLADEISWRYDCAVYIVTIYDYEDYDSDIHYAAVNIYDSNSFGIGENREGIMLMLSTYDRDYDLYVRDGGTAEYAVNKYGRHQMTEEFLDNFADDDWAGGFRDYLNACAEYLSLAEQGHPVRKPLIKVLPMALGIGVVLALAVCLFLKAKMKSVRQGAEADTYVTAEGLNLTEQYDNYTHTTETRRKISQDSDGGSSDHSGGGGSSTSGKY